jgi:hypothetical protein
MKLPSGKTAKKPYLPPKLLVYGDLTQMTTSTGYRGRPDGGKKAGKNRSG